MVVAYVDTETAVSKVMMQKLGVNIEELIYYAPDTIEEIFKFFESTVLANTDANPDTPILLIWDSVAASSTKYEMENDYGQATMAIHARLISQALRKFTRIMSKRKVSALFLNQQKSKIGIMFGDKVATMGGDAIKFSASIRLQLDLKTRMRVEHHKEKKIVGINVEATCIKNKLAVPFGKAMLPIHFGYGIDDAFAALYWLEDNDLIENNQGHYTMTIGETEYKFTKATWREIFDKNYDVIAQSIMESVDSDANTKFENTVAMEEKDE